MEKQQAPEEQLSKLAPLFLPKSQRKQRLFEEKIAVKEELNNKEGQEKNHGEVKAGFDKGQIKTELVVKTETENGNSVPDDSKKRKVGRPKKALGEEKLTDTETGGLHISVPRPPKEGATFEGKERSLLTNSLQPGDCVVMKLDETASKKVPDIFLTANERKQRQQAAKREEKRVQNERAAAVEQAKLEKLRVKEERKKAAEERKLKAKGEKVKAAEEKKLKAKAEKEAAKRGVESTDEGTPKKKKRGRPPKAKESELELIQTSENEGGAPQGPSLLEKMRKRQEDFKESIRESQEAHAKLHAGKATHPFFMRKQGPPAANGAAHDGEPPQVKEAKPVLEPLYPTHVNQAEEEEAPFVQWSERQLSSREASTSEHSLELPSLVSLLDLSSPTIDNGRPVHAAPSLQEIQENGLKALFDFVQVRGGSSELDSLHALKRRFERYRTRAAGQRAEEENRVNPISETGGESAQNGLWCFKYEPLSSEEVCGNQSSVAFIRDWLSEWTDTIAREQQKKLLTSAKPKADTWQASEESSEWLVSGGCSDSELGDEEGGPPNVLLLSGPPGVGKTATVYALAKELVYQVLESNPSERRSRALVLQRFGEATESKGLLKWSLKGRNGPPEKKTGGAKGALARFYGQQKGSPDKKGVPASKQVKMPSKRSTRKRRQKSRLSESEISAFQETVSLDSVISNKRARTVRKRAKQVEVNAEEDQGTEQNADGHKGEKRSGKRRKKVGFNLNADVKEEPLAEAPAEEEQSERVEAEGDACEKVKVEAGSAEENALGSGKKPVLEGEAAGIASGIEYRSSVEKPAEKDTLGFEPVYKRRKSNGTKSGAQKLKSTEEPDEDEGERQREIVDCKGRNREQRVDVENGSDKERTKGLSGVKPKVSPSGPTSDSLETPAKTVSSEVVAKEEAKGKKRRGAAQNGNHDGLPTKKRRSFGRPAVLSKVRTRPFSPEDKEAPNCIDTKGPLVASVAAPRDESIHTGAEKELGATQGNDVNGPGPEVGHVTAGEATRGEGKHSSKALLLFEEVETQFEEDKGFMSAVSTLAASTKRPMILTCNEPAEVVPACDFRKLTVEFGAPPVLELTVHTCLVAASEGFPVNPWVVERLVKLSKGDIRRVLLQVQLWSQPGLSVPRLEEPLQDVLRPLSTAEQASAGMQKAIQTMESSPPEKQKQSVLPHETSNAQSAVDAPAELSQPPMTTEQQLAIQQSTGAQPQDAESEPKSKVETSRRMSTLWLSDAVQELQSDAAHRSLPALADVSLPCQLATAVAAHHNRKILHQERLAEISVGEKAARIYGGLEEEALCAARIRKALQEAKAAARAAGKVELAEKRRLAREARRAAKRAEENGDEKMVVPETDLELEDVPMGSPVRKRLRGRRVALSEDDFSEGPADVSRLIFQAGEESAEEIEAQMQEAQALHADQACAMCGQRDAEESMLLCDGEGCQGAIHTFCSQPPMESIPEGNWFCVNCSNREKAGGCEEVQLERKEEGNGMNGEEDRSSKGDVSGRQEARPLNATKQESLSPSGRQQESLSPERGQQESLILERGDATGGGSKLQGSQGNEEQLFVEKRGFDERGLRTGGEDKLDRDASEKEQGLDVGGLQQQTELQSSIDCGLLEDARDSNGRINQEVVELPDEAVPNFKDSLPEEVEDLQVEDMRKLISRESRQAVPISAALWKLTDDLSASEMMSRELDLAGDSTPSFEEDVPKQAAACLAYASLRCRLESLSAAKHSSIGASKHAKAQEEPSIAQVRTGDVTNGKMNSCDVLDSDDVKEAAKELEMPGQLLAAAGNEEALCRFLAAEKREPDLRWLRLRMEAPGEERGLERTVVTQSFRELSVEVTSSRSCAWLRTGLASLEYASFLGQMSDLIEQRENQDAGWLRSERGASQPYVPAWDVPDQLLRTIKQSVKYGPRC